MQADENSAARVEELRGEIDATDRQLVELLNRRASLAAAVGQVKRDAGQAVYRPEREEQVLAQAAARSGGPLGAAAIRAIFGEVISACRSLERDVRVGYLGPPGTFTHEATLRKFGASATMVACGTIEEVFREAERGNVEYGVIPVENSTAGSVVPTLEAFLESSLQVCAEIELPIVHNLFSRGQLSEIRRVYSHPQSFAQCRRWLAEHLPQAEQVTVASNSLAVKIVAANDVGEAAPSDSHKRGDAAPASLETGGRGDGAIGPEAAGRLYGVPILVSHIEDSTVNVTRFLVLGRERSARTGRDKSAIVFSIKNRPGALRDALDVFASRGIDLTWIESRPLKRDLWQYAFFVDLVGHPDDATVGEALRELEAEAVFLKVLGAWPMAPQAGQVASAGRAGAPEPLGSMGREHDGVSEAK